MGRGTGRGERGASAPAPMGPTSVADLVGSDGLNELVLPYPGRLVRSSRAGEGVTRARADRGEP